MIKVLTYGTFDLLHHGHIRLLERAKALGDHLTVAVSTDEFNLGKGKVCAYPYEERACIVAAIKYVDAVIPETTWEQKIKDIQEHNIDIFVIGDDWAGKFDFLKEYCEVVYLPRTEGVSTTQTKNALANLKSKKE
ncbi:glycerol-3-phosphate cytidylyltransferase [Wielerella bovis]|uniref:glycerol-3-phosphate cytidylyltransferase n=1 Tax=Wielerella bovis TaxID=2917790 RepID=UPI0020190A8E|nr:glycerol-3-phosphate cytidylyltransferase [Wielerella bovis]ULJ60957.1 glycerol-3-phosphate cytidylyltransferase [Wielerella bovis]